ncbi:putative N-acetylmannosamine-6-phosphate 2-epimerase [Mollicutes bacterium LVI A0039]|nr:putative N-acetylmannosamine-6-phosphate 2-epimerase [Mollicutes bacterium LVI A0039]
MQILNKLQAGLIVSCQALADEPLHSAEVMAMMAQAAYEGGAVGIRANSVIDIKAIKSQVDLPIIGIIKAEYPESDVYITPTFTEVKQLVECGVEIIAVDCTARIRPHGHDLVSFWAEVKSTYPNQLFMADCSTTAEVAMAVELGFDIISSTLVNYTEQSKNHMITDDDYRILREMIAITHDAQKFFIAEGNINTPQMMQDVLSIGADSVVVGSMITRPQVITKKFTSNLAREVKFIDMDGVLVDEHASIEPKTMETIQSGNFMTVINTGRLMHDIDYVIDKYSLNSSFKIAANGAHIQSRTGQDIVVHTLSSDIRNQIYQKLRGPEFSKVRLEVNTINNRYFFTERPSDFPKEFKDSSIVTNIDQIIDELEVIGFLVIFEDYQEIADTVSILAKKFEGVVEFERSSNTSLEVFSSKASKGSAIKYLKDNKYIDSSVKTLAYGDSFNDLSMFSEVDTSYAIQGNSEVEGQADIVIKKLIEGL